MYCNQCGKSISQISKFCNYCGSPVFIDEKKDYFESPQSSVAVAQDDDVSPIVAIEDEDQQLVNVEIAHSQIIVDEAVDVKNKRKTDFEEKQRATSDPVTAIQRKLTEIDMRPKPQTKKKGVVKSALKVIKGETSVFDLFEDDFEAKKLTDKKNLILNYQLPKSPKLLAKFARYAHSKIISKSEKASELAGTWKEKLKQIYDFAKIECGDTKEFEEIKRYHKSISRREKNSLASAFAWLLFFPVIAILVRAILSQSPGLLFVSIVALGWTIFYNLYVYNALESMIFSIKRNSAKMKGIPKILRVFAWHLLIPIFSALIVAIVYKFIALIAVAAILFIVDGFFLLAIIEV